MNITKEIKRERFYLNKCNKMVINKLTSRTESFSMNWLLSFIITNEIISTKTVIHKTQSMTPHNEVMLNGLFNKITGEFIPR